MLTYIRRLTDERDSLTQTATQLTETAARDQRDVTDTERASLASMATRCAAIDEQLTTYQAQAESMRAYATLRGALTAADQDDSGAGDSGGGGNQQRGAELETRDALDDDETFGATFEQRAPDVIGRWSGRGKSEPIELGSALSERAIVTSADVPPERTRRTPTPPQWRSSLVGLVTTVPTTTSVVEWLRTSPNPPSEAAEVAEGAVKPEAEFDITLEEDKLKTFAHWKGATRQALEDMSTLRSILESRLRIGLLRKIASEVAATLLADSAIPALQADSLLTGIRIGMASFDDESGYAATGVALNPLDWADVDLEALGRTLGQPTVNSGAWGLRFAASSRIPRGQAYVGDFGQAVSYFDRRATQVFVTDSHADFFLRNQVVILAETRGLVVVEEPAALIKVTTGEGDGGGSRVTVQQQGDTVTATADEAPATP